jgi:hypothetical protein
VALSREARERCSRALFQCAHFFSSVCFFKK